ncbi:chromate transporter [Risungbinella massiliensis]|uniref:chromate transporter n=1 Tax=Risungbinella massiliensis TaxID=1329796 RepID=UPI0005CBBE36|nr:chromate transporter [Risungbinella massiliensis]
MTLLGQLFLAFFRSGMLGYGGGPAVIPLIHQEIVNRYQWMNNKEFSDVIAIGNSLPGPIATKLAGYIGYRIAGVLGCITCLIAIVMPTVILMIALLNMLAYFQNNPNFQGLTKAINPVIAMMLAALAFSFLQKSWGRTNRGTMIILTLTSLVLISFVGIHPAIVIGMLIVIAIFPQSRHLLREEIK